MISQQYSSWRKKNPCEEIFFIFPIFRKQNNLLIFFTNEFQLLYGFIYLTIAFFIKPILSLTLTFLLAKWLHF